MGTDKTEGKLFNVTLPEDLHMRLKLKAVREKTTMNELIIKAVEEFLEEGFTGVV